MKSLIQTLDRNGLLGHLTQLNRGLEKESLRVDSTGVLSQSPHPISLGSALTHPLITTDYSEALLEFVTAVHTTSDDLLQQLFDIHQFTYQNIGDEKLWINSMPCIVEGENKIPIARFGSSNVAQMKEAYREGLGYRYGKLMQTIAGIHFNFSLPAAFWPEFLDFRDEQDRQDQQSAHYFSLVRNFHRFSWLPCYLFGASPAVCKSFLRNREHDLIDLGQTSFYSPYATSLRLSGLGYSNNAQSNIEICYNTIDSFTQSLRQAIQTSNPEYEKIGVKVNGEYRQLNTNWLQIENEYYSVIRPKRVTQSGESPTNALIERGVQYVEVRSLDLNPFSPIGIDKSCVCFFDIFLLYCLFCNNQDISASERKQAAENRHRVVMEGRKPGLTIISDQGESNMLDTASELLSELEPIAETLDKLNNSTDYSDSLAEQWKKIEDPDITPSAKILNEMQNKDLSFYEFSMQQAEIHEQFFKRNCMTKDKIEQFRSISESSLQDQLNIEKSDEVSFDDFLADYQRRQNNTSEDS